ncbi:MAG: hypothetical protein Q8Q31_05065 [Nanoarchaeota archaeon]|nr:hypothetical protein [Nanoarchaeota archaeon]
MENYNIEASGVALKGIITCGSLEGYESTGASFTLENLLGFLDETNKEILEEGLKPIPCIIYQGTLVGRSNSGQYREEVYTLDFSWSPRVGAPLKEVFLKTLMEYADRLGKKMKQTRIYVEFEGKTTVLKKKSD